MFRIIIAIIIILNYFFMDVSDWQNKQYLITINSRHHMANANNNVMTGKSMHLLLSVFNRRKSHDLGEQPGEIIRVFHSQFIRDLFDPEFRE